MEFLLGVVVAFVSIVFVRSFILTSDLNSPKMSKIIYRQSHLFSLVAPAIPYLPLTNTPPKTQSREYDQKNKLRIVFSGSKAYWIKDNTFFEASVVDGIVDESTTKRVDTIAMDKVELDKMIFIVQKLTEGNNDDGGNSGK